MYKHIFFFWALSLTSNFDGLVYGVFVVFLCCGCVSRESCVFAKGLRVLSLITSCFVNCEKMMTIIHVIPVFPQAIDTNKISYLQFSKRSKRW